MRHRIALVRALDRVSCVSFQLSTTHGNTAEVTTAAQSPRPLATPPQHCQATATKDVPLS